MPRGRCHRHGQQFGPCSCSLGKLPRLVEPVLLSLLDRGEAAYGYELQEKANEIALTDSEIDVAVVYRTLRSLEEAGCVTSVWKPGAGGPQRRLYEITPLGRSQLQDWLIVLRRHTDALERFLQARTHGLPTTDEGGPSPWPPARSD